MFGTFVTTKGLCTAEELKIALKVAQFRKEKLGRLLVELGYFGKETLDQVLIEYLNPVAPWPYHEMLTKKRRFELDGKIQPLLTKHQVIGLERKPHALIVLATAFTDEVIRQLESLFQLEIQLFTVSHDIFRLLACNSEDAILAKSDIILSAELSSEKKLNESNPYAELIASCLQEAMEKKASDIHFEPFDSEYLIRFRIHGVLQEWKRLTPEHAEPLTNTLKWILNLDLAIAAKPQDARATLESLRVDLRVNSLPLANRGEKIVVRIQYQEQKFTLSGLGLDPTQIDVLLRAIQKRDGLIVISGPTGSGKTTTLYALLEEMDRLGKNISTLENPVEKRLTRVNQANISTSQDFTDFQRALMRQDPDVILLGEIRDEETAELSMKLASTGHLVLSTVHANGAREVIDRLMNLGLDLFSIKTNLRLSVAQRLLRTICPHCSLPEGPYRYFTKKGCHYCQRGVVGRIAIIEYLERAQIENLGNGEIQMVTTLKEECEKLAQKGIIDGSEVESIS